jgi:hypothetical protein
MGRNYYLVEPALVPLIMEGEVEDWWYHPDVLHIGKRSGVLGGPKFTWNINRDRVKQEVLQGKMIFKDTYTTCTLQQFEDDVEECKLHNFEYMDKGRDFD